jgi:uncharacterized membrane protein
MPLALATSVSADSATTAAVLFFIAWTLRLAFSPGQRVTPHEAVGLIALAVLLGLVKPGYWPVAAAALLIPPSRFRSRSSRIVVLASVAVATVTPTLIFVLMQRSLLPPAASPDQVWEQLRFIGQAPFAYLTVLMRSLWIGFHKYSASFVGVLGRADVWLPVPLYLAYLAALLASALLDVNDPNALTPPRRWGLLALFGACVALLMTMAYAAWNPIGAPVIRAVHGRYFIGISALLLVALPAGVLPLRWKPPGLPAQWVISFAILVQGVVLWTMLHRYWV